MMNLAPTAVLNDFRSYSAVELYGLFQEIYSSSDGMSELLVPDARRLEEDVEALYRLPGAVSLVGMIGKTEGPDDGIALELVDHAIVLHDYWNRRQAKLGANYIIGAYLH
jgi:hypothetical protein